MKKPRLNLILTLALGLPVKHNDVFHCLYEGKFGEFKGWPNLPKTYLHTTSVLS